LAKANKRTKLQKQTSGLVVGSFQSKVVYSYWYKQKSGNASKIESDPTGSLALNLIWYPSSVIAGLLNAQPITRSQASTYRLLDMPVKILLQPITEG